MSERVEQQLHACCLHCEAHECGPDYSGHLHACNGCQHDAKMIDHLEAARSNLDRAWGALRVPLTGDAWSEAEQVVVGLRKIIEYQRAMVEGRGKRPEHGFDAWTCPHCSATIGGDRVSHSCPKLAHGERPVQRPEERFGDTELEKCRVCRGIGRVGPPMDERKCASCGGTGKEREGAWKTPPPASAEGRLIARMGHNAVNSPSTEYAMSKSEQRRIDVQRWCSDGEACYDPNCKQHEDGLPPTR